MSTRSYVGIIENGKVKYGYHHCDSHLESLGIDLFKSITTKAEANEKINKFAELDMGGTASRDAFFAIPSIDIFIEFCYGFDVNDNQWYVSSYHFTDSTKEFKLVDVAQDDDEMTTYLSMYHEQYRKDIRKEIQENIRTTMTLNDVWKYLCAGKSGNGINLSQFYVNNPNETAKAFWNGVLTVLEIEGKISEANGWNIWKELTGGK